jgi:hypothetical protein
MDKIRRKGLTKALSCAIIQTDKRKGNKTMFEEMMNQMSDYSYESAHDEPEIWVEDWPDDLWDE